MSLEDKHLEHIAAMQAISDYSWHSWNSPVGLSIFFIAFPLSISLSFLIVRYAILLH